MVEILSPELTSGAVALSTSLGGPANGPTEPAKVGKWKPDAVSSLESTDARALGSLDSSG